MAAQALSSTAVRQGQNRRKSVASAGDVNGDGIDDLIIGASLANPNNQANAGQSYVVFGKRTHDQDGQLLDGVAGSFDLANLATGDGSAGFVINGAGTNNFSGLSVASAGDVNGDGYADVIIGAQGVNADNQTSAGASYVVFGKATHDENGILRSDVVKSINLADVANGDGSAGFVINGAKKGGQSGHSVAGVGDMNGDGYDDLIIGAKAVGEQEGPFGGTTLVGESYVIYGQESYDSGVMHLASMLGIRSFVSTPENNTDTIYTAAATDIMMPT